MKITEEITIRGGSASLIGRNPDPSLGKPDRVNIHDIKRADFYGFGAALTEAAAFTYSLMSPDRKKEYLEKVFGPDGLDYRICRICIGSSDFSLADHVYIDDGDMTLSSFDLGIDKDYVIPMALDVLNFRNGDVDFFASPWSPPAFMKDSGSRIGGHLKPECRHLYAEYFARFIEEYKNHGIVIGAVTPQNEPGNGTGWETCLYSDQEEAEFIKELKKSFRAHNLETRILCWDYNRYGLFDRASYIFDRCGDDVDGAAFHWYSKGGCFEDISLLRELYPDKVLIESEFTNSQKNYFGRYIDEIRRVIHAGTNAVVEWNALLDERGMPCHNRDWGCISPVHYDRGTGTLYNSVNYDEIRMISHFVKNGDSILRTSASGNCLDCAAVKKTDGSIFLCLSNPAEARNVRIKHKDGFIDIMLPSECDTSLLLTI